MCICELYYNFIKIDNITLMRLIRKGNQYFLNFEQKDYSFQFEIKYCPFCGKELNYNEE